MRVYKKEAQMKEVLSYITDFMKQVIENGNRFKIKDLLILLE